jgi:uncharacterized Zn finger protein (UPF0148 family)
MAETLVENRTCSACGVDVRTGALFCYNCGGSVAPEIPVSENQEPVTVAMFRENTDGEISKDENLEQIEDAATAETVVAETVDVPVKKTDIYEEGKLKSAASLRRKAKTFQKRKIEEIAWTGHENAPNAWFILVALILTLFAVAVFWLAIRLR